MPPDQLDIYAVDVAAELSCLDHDPELFFSADPSDVEAAKLVCQTCPLMQECLDGALRRREPHGVWGGQLIVEGVIVARKRPRGRPRKNPLPEPPLPEPEPTPLPAHQPARIAAQQRDDRAAKSGRVAA